MSHHASHPSSARLRQALDGELAPRQSAAVEQHVVDCDDCRQQMEQMTADGGAYQTAPSRVSALRSRLRDGLLDLSGELSVATSSEPRSRLAPALAMVVLAAFAVAAGARQRPAERVGAAWLLKSDRQSALPDAAFTPGAVHRATVAELCAGRQGLDRAVSPRVRQAVLRDYRMEAVPAQEYELDYLITPELGGAPTRQNLWPERYASRIWNARVKDQLEDLLPRMVCEGRLDLATAQRDIAADWIAAYKKYFHTDHPLVSQIAMRDDDEVVRADENLDRELTKPLVALAQLAWR